MHAQLISIGNSKGVRLPASLLRQYQITDAVELLPGKDEIIIRPASRTARQDWDSAFAAMHTNNDDTLLLDDTANLTMEDWEWK